MKSLKRNAVIITVLLFVCAAVYLNWAYNNKWGGENPDMTQYEDEAMAEANERYEEALLGRRSDETETGANEIDLSDYFAAARLTRQQSRDEALRLLQEAAATEMASQEVIDSATNEIAVMASNTMQEAQIENLLLAKDFAECVVFISGNNVTVAVPAPVEGLSESAVARITDIIVNETGFPASALTVIEVKNSQG